MQGLILIPLLIGAIIIVVLSIAKPKFIFPLPQKDSRLKAFFLPFLSGISSSLLCLIIVLLVLFTLFPPHAGHGQAGAGLAIVLLVMIASLSLINGIVFGILNSTRKESAPIRWRGMAISFFLTGFFPAVFYILVPAGMFIGGAIVLLLPFIIIGGLIFLAYKLMKHKEKPKAERMADKQIVAHEEGEKTKREFPAFFLSVNITLIIPIIISAVFLLTAFFVLKHWAMTPQSGGWIPMDGVIEIYSLIGLQIIASVLCVGSVFTFTIILPLAGRVRVKRSVLSGIFLTLVALLINFFLDLIGVVIMGAALGIKM